MFDTVLFGIHIPESGGDKENPAQKCKHNLKKVEDFKMKGVWAGAGGKGHAGDQQFHNPSSLEKKPSTTPSLGNLPGNLVYLRCALLVLRVFVSCFKRCLRVSDFA